MVNLKICKICTQYLEDCECCEECGHVDHHARGCSEALTDRFSIAPARQTLRGLGAAPSRDTLLTPSYSFPVRGSRDVSGFEPTSRFFAEGDAREGA